MTDHKRIGMFFDLFEGSGLGHFARARAITETVSAVMSQVDFAFVPLVFGNQRIISLKSLGVDLTIDSRMLSGKSPIEIMGSYDACVVDSYEPELQSLRWLPELAERHPQVHVAVVCDSQWPGLVPAPASEKLRLVLDPTYALEGSVGTSMRRSGPEAIFLNNRHIYPRCYYDPRGDILRENPVHGDRCPQVRACVGLGASRQAVEAMPFVVAYFREQWSRVSIMQPGSRYGWVKLLDDSAQANWTAGTAPTEYLVGDVLAHASDLVLAAGQMMWEAASVRPSFWVLALHGLHVEILHRLFIHGAFQPLQENKVGTYRAWQVQVPEKTRQILQVQQERGREIFEFFLDSSQSGNFIGANAARGE